MIKKFYHATTADRLASITFEGVKPMIDFVYLCDTAVDCIKFLQVRMIPLEDIRILEVEIDDSLVEESFDHSYEFFKCKAYLTQHTIEPDKITAIYAVKRKEEDVQ